jgi:hypothetical protein
MATVPGTPDNVIGIHPAFQPTQADLLQAAAIMHQQGKFDPIARTLETPEQKEQRERDELSGIPESARTPITPRGGLYGSRERGQYFQKMMRGVRKGSTLGPEKGEEIEEGEPVYAPGRDIRRL